MTFLKQLNSSSSLEKKSGLGISNGYSCEYKYIIELYRSRKSH